jgi:DNA-binding CsgD family transcriptional regulator
MWGISLLATYTYAYESPAEVLSDTGVFLRIASIWILMYSTQRGWLARLRPGDLDEMADLMRESCGLDDLTPRQGEVLQLAVNGLSAKQIARRLGISARTVEGHLAAIRTRTATGSQAMLIAWAVASGVIAPTPYGGRSLGDA